MSIPSRNIKKPASPIPKQGYPENRMFQKVAGVTIKVGSVISVGNTGGGENWWGLARTHDVRPWEIIRFNFDTDIPEEVNWYLQEYVGCHRLGPRGRNYRFEGARPGLILMPWGEAINKILVERENKPPKEEDELDKRWPDRKTDISAGRRLIDEMLRRTHRQVVEWKPNPLDFDIKKEVKDKIFSPGGPKFGFGDLLVGVLKTFNESDPANQAVRRIREDIHSAFASGVANVLFPGSRHSMQGRSGYARVFFDKGRSYASTLTPTQRYQFCLALAENDRHYGLGGYQPLQGNKSFYRVRISQSSLEHLIQQEFSRKKYLFRN